MKFDLFNSATWEESVRKVDIEKAIENKALGAIGQKIREVRDLDKRIKEKLATKKDQDDYLIAVELARLNPEAFKIMQVDIILPDNKIAIVLQDIEFVLSGWTSHSQEERKYHWKNLIDPLKRLKPFMGEDFFSAQENERAFNELQKIVIKGNKAWDVYLEAERRKQSYQKSYLDLQRKISTLNLDDDDDPESHDFDDEPDSV